MKKNLGLFLAIILVQIAPFISAADTLYPLIYKIDIKKEISNTTRLYLSNGLAEAYALGADAVLIHMNTYGGQVDAADSMRSELAKHFGVSMDVVENCRTYGGHGEQMAVYASTAKVEGKPLAGMIGTDALTKDRFRYIEQSNLRCSSY